MNNYDLSHYEYSLPESLIAQYPKDKRDESRLLVMDRRSGALKEDIFCNIGNYLDYGDLLVVNDTRVFPARLFGHKESEKGAKSEVLLLKQISERCWEALVRPGKKLLPGVSIIFNGGILKALVKDFLKETDGGRILEFEFSGDFFDILEKTGNIPLPPYIKRVPEKSDLDRYQTVYAGNYGAVAAPTAGLHFTPALLESLKKSGIERANLTLNVGIGTFRPISVDDLRQHKMHSESYSVSQETAEAISKTIENNSKVVAVGTTTVRTLETIGLPVIPSFGETSIFIYPPFNFRVVSAIVTNFHLPRSSLLVMISAFAGRDNIISAYEYAVKKGFRFFSYGDAMLIV